MNFPSSRIERYNRLLKFLETDFGILRFIGRFSKVLDEKEIINKKIPRNYEDENPKNENQKDNKMPEDFTEIVEKYGSFVYNIARQSAHSDADADDIAQEVFIKAWKSRESFRQESNISTWLGRIAINTCIDFARNKKRKAAVSLTSFSENDDESKEFDIPDTDISSNPEAFMEKTDRIDAVRKAIASLSEEHKIVVILRDMEGYTYSEIAEMLELELGTVKSRINRARLHIKDYLISRNILE